MTVTEDELAARRERGVQTDDAADDTPEQETPETEPAAEVEVKPTPPTQLALPGTRERINATIGGRTPDDSQLRIMGGRRPIAGQYEKGERVPLLCDTIIRQIDLIDHDDEWGTVSSTTRSHKARLLTVAPATPERLVKSLLDQVGFEQARILLAEAAGQ